MAMNVGAAREGEPVSEINSTPLIDVMLVLLIMLIVALPAQRHAVTVDPPQYCGECIQPVAALEPVRISIDFDGAYYWNGAPASEAEIERRLGVEARRPEQPEVHIEPHRLASYGKVAGVMAAAQREGITRLGVRGET